MSKKTRLVSLILLTSSFVSGNVYANIIPEKSSVNIVQQRGKVVCVVKDELGPVVGASVVVKNTTNGNVTDLEGRVVLEGVKKGDIIQVSYIGYTTQEIVYDGSSQVQVSLKEDTQALEEVVVVGYGTMKKKDLTGSIATVDSDVLEDRPIANLGSGLQGTIANLNISSSN